MSTQKRSWGIVLALVVSTLVGCGDSSNSGGGASMDDLAAADSAQRADADEQQKKAEEEQAAAASQTPAEQATEQEKRKVAGREALPEGGYFTAIAGARRHVLNAVDNIAWIQGVRSFKAEEGRKPKDSDEFMNVVVPKYELQLPAIEADEEYLYDPAGETDGDFGQLYVVKKAGAAEEPAPAPTP